MKVFIEGFPQQMLHALAICKTISLTQIPSSISNVVVCGLGGSGIAGDLIHDLCVGDIAVPIVVNKGYDLPHFVNDKSLLILCSYSGNTEEVLSCFAQARDKKLKPICVAAGGKLKELALANACDFIELPSGFPPRTTLGYGAAILLSILKKVGLISKDVEGLFKNCSSFLQTNQTQISSDAKALAAKTKFKTIIATAEDRMGSIALRLKQQINENSKQNCWYHVVPELNHNELVGWKMKNNSLASIFLRHSYEHPRNQLRFRYIKPIFEENVDTFTEIYAQGSNFFEQCFYHIHLGDWWSYHLGMEHAQDPTEVKVIDGLKNFLNSQS